MTRPLFALCVVSLSLFTAACGGCDDPIAMPGGNDGGVNNTNNNVPDGGDPNNVFPDVPVPDDDMGTGDDDMAMICETVVCGGECCAEGDECVEDVCRPPCAGARCGEMSELCCEGMDVCIFDQCILPGDPCQSSFQCPDDQYCELILGACVPRDLINVDCEYRPPVGMFTPSPENQFDGVDINGTIYNGSITSPIVADVDADGMPEIVVQLYTGALGQSLIAVLNGEDMSIVAYGGVGEVQPNAAGIATANLDPTTDEFEIVAQAAGGGLVAYSLDVAAGTLNQMWINTSGNLGGISNEGAPSIADLDSDGTPEIIMGFSVVDPTGAIWNGLDGGAAGGQGGNAGITTAVDLDLADDANGNKNLELIAGNRAMRLDGTMYYDVSATYQDGFPAVADLDGDGVPEIATVSRGNVFVLNSDGSNTVFGPIPIPGGGQGGPPTIADFDGDGRREIAAAGQGQYTVFDPDCTGATPDLNFCPTGGAGEGILWTVAVQDLSSSRTGSSVFDFEGDGKAEVVYNDECFLRVLDGTNGNILYETANTTRTGSEAPIVVDVDADFNAEIVVVSNNDQINRDQCETNYPNYPVGGTTGVFVYGDANDNWVTTRRLWNQHAYHITHILDDGSVPGPEPVHYQGDVTNSFRLNVQPDGLFNAPDLVVESVDIRNPTCGDQVTVEIAVTVTNEGSLGVGAGTEVLITADNNGDMVTVGTVTTTEALLPSQSETILITFTLPPGWENADFTVNGVVDPNMTINECIEDNNSATGMSSAGNRTFDDLTITELLVNDNTCGTNGRVIIDLTIENNGAQGVPANLPIVLEALRGTTATAIDTVRTSGGLSPNGGSESFTVTWDAPAGLLGSQFEVRASIDPNGEVTACSSDNATVPADCLPPQ